MRRRDALVKIEELAVKAIDPSEAMTKLWGAFCRAQPLKKEDPDLPRQRPRSSVVSFSANNPDGEKDILKISFDLKTRRTPGGLSKFVGVKIRATWASLDKDV